MLSYFLLLVNIQFQIEIILTGSKIKKNPNQKTK